MDDNSLGINDYIGERIQRCRTTAKLTQAELGLAIGVSDKQIAKYESGKNRVSAARLWDIASVLKVDIEDFFKDIEASSPSGPGVSQISAKVAEVEARSGELIEAYQNISDPYQKEALKRLMYAMAGLDKTKG